jgi:hypothetical protein
VTARFGRTLLLASLIVSSACSDDGATTTTTTTPTPTGNITETFTGTLALNGAATFPFTALSSGALAATLTCIQPAGCPDPPPAVDTTLIVGMWLGVWANGTCQFGVANDDALQGSTINAFAVQAGNYCVRVYDSKGNLPATENYRIDVTHP